MPPGHKHYGEIRCQCGHHKWVKSKPRDSSESPFEVMIDSREQQPYTFEGLMTNVDQGSLPIRVRTRREGLPVGDYSIFGLPSGIIIERKSKEDLYSSISQRRENFEDRLRKMSSEFMAAAVVVECEWADMILNPPAFSQFNPKALARTLDSWMIRFRVHWLFMPDRSTAEAKTYRLLEMFHHLHERGETAIQEEHGRWAAVGYPGLNPAT
jgi:ERCC4-type nuclease